MPRGDGRVLSRRALGRAALARQQLLARERTTITRTLERMAGLQAQYAPSMYVGLWSRIEGFERGHLTAALERRTVVQGTLQRDTIHLVSARDYWPFALAVRAARRRWWLRVSRDQTDADLVAAAARVRDHLAAAGVAGRAVLEQVAGAGPARGVGLWLDLVRVPPSGTWERRRADLYALAEDWLGAPAADADDAAVHLVRRYLAGFGPAPRHDIAGWAGLPLGAVDEALERLPLRRFRDDDGRELLDLPRAPLPHPDTPAPVRFLPTFDAVLLAHARRTGILPEHYRSLIFHSKAPQSFPTFTVDGAVAGTWRYDEGRVAVSPFEPLDADTTAQVRAEADRLAAFHA